MLWPNEKQLLINFRINQTIKRIEKTAKLKVIGIKKAIKRAKAASVSLHCPY